MNLNSRKVFYTQKVLIPFVRFQRLLIRSLSQMHGVKALYEKRMPIYRQFADIEVDGNGTVEEVANRIVKEIVSL